MMGIFIIGTLMGSFMLCLVEEQQCIFRRSCCDHCGGQLRWFELIPIISFVVQRGRCRRCLELLDSRYVIVELTSGLLFLLSDLTFGLQPFSAALIAFLIPLAVYDTQHFKIPNHVLLLMAALFVMINGRLLLDADHLLSVIVVTLLLHLFYFLTASIGYGDIKLLVLLALFMPWPFFIMVFMLTYITGGAAAIIFLCYKEHLKKVPLVPFITLSSLITLMYFPSLYLIYFGGFL